MFEKIQKGLARTIASQLRCPTDSFAGRLLARRFQRQSAFLEKGAVKLLNIQPDDRVLEVGFGGGVGLRTAYWRVKEGRGMIYGVEKSHFMFRKAKQYCALEISECKVHLTVGLVTNLPFPDLYFDRVFHCNAYYYWGNLILAAAELKRVMRPGAVMVTTLSLDDLKTAEQEGYLDDADPDPVGYMHALETVGFEGVHVQYLTGDEKMYQAIFATNPLKIEALTDEALEIEEERFRKSISAFKAAEAMKQSHGPTVPGYDPYDPLSKKSKVKMTGDMDDSSANTSKIGIKTEGGSDDKNGSNRPDGSAVPPK